MSRLLIGLGLLQQTVETGRRLEPRYFEQLVCQLEIMVVA